MPIIETENISHIYSKNTPFERRALDGVSFYVEKNEFVGIIGHTGSGKSTLVQHLNGLLKPSEGRVFIDGKDIWQNSAEVSKYRYKVGLAFQYPEHQLFEETVYKDIAFGPKNLKLSDDEIHERVIFAMEFVGLSENLLDKSPFELSGGQKRRAAIAGIIAMKPDVLILDEPTAGLDPQGAKEILSKISEYRRKNGTSVVLVTHNMADIAENCDRIYVMNKSKIAMQGTADEIFSRYSELSKIDLDVPQITKVFLHLKEAGIDTKTNIYSVSNAKQEVLRLLKAGGKNA